MYQTQGTNGEIILICQYGVSLNEVCMGTPLKKNSTWIISRHTRSQGRRMPPSLSSKPQLVHVELQCAAIHQLDDATAKYDEIYYHHGLIKKATATSLH